MSDDNFHVEPEVTEQETLRFPKNPDHAAIPWTAGQTFQQAILAALPTAMFQKTLTRDATIYMEIVVKVNLSA